MRRFVLAALITLGALGAVQGQEDLKVSIEADGEPLLLVVKKICGSHGLNYVASEAALERAGKVSLKLQNVPLEEALDSICEVHGLEARVRGKIVTLRLREVERREETKRRAEPVKPRSPSRFVEEGPSPAPAPKVEELEPAQPPVAAPSTADVGTQAPLPPAPVATSGGGAIVVGTVIDVTSETVTVKEARGDPREFHIPATRDNDTARGSRLTLAFKRLKKGDRIALEYRTEAGRPVVTNLVGGGKLSQ